LYQFGVVMQNYQEAKASDQLIKELLALGDDDIVTYGKEHLSSIDHISFDDVSFSYMKDKDVLQHVSWSADQ
jgi:ABC-type multidrug transport system fused ATPase/permease subunit